MLLTLRGIKALIIGFVALAIITLFFVIAVTVSLAVLPVALILGIVIFITRRIIRKKKTPSGKEPRGYIDAEFKVKE